MSFRVSWMLIVEVATTRTFRLRKTVDCLLRDFKLLFGLFSPVIPESPCVSASNKFKPAVLGSCPHFGDLDLRLVAPLPNLIVTDPTRIAQESRMEGAEALAFVAVAQAYSPLSLTQRCSRISAFSRSSSACRSLMTSTWSSMTCFLTAASASAFSARSK